MTRKKAPRSALSPVPRSQLPAFEPVPRRNLRHDGWTPARQRGFIEALADTGSVEAACRAVDMATEGAYQLRRQPGAESFRAAWAAALDCGVTMLEDKVMERAIHGTEVPVLSCGKQFGTRRVYNERVALLILQARLPEKYGMQRARTMSGLDHQVLARMKREWRREWELEAAHRSQLAAAARPADAARDEEAVYDSIADKLEQMAERERARQSPATRALHAAWLASKAEDEARGFQWWLDPKNPFYEGGTGAGTGNGPDADAPAPFIQAEFGDEGESAEEWAARALPPPGWGERAEEEPEPDDGPRVRTLKDAGW